MKRFVFLFLLLPSLVFGAPTSSFFSTTDQANLDATVKYNYIVDSTALDIGVASGGYSTLKDHIDAIGSNTASIFFPVASGGPVPYTLSTTESVPANITLVFQNGAMIADSASNASLSILGEVDAKPTQRIFDFDQGTGTVSFSDSLTTTCYPEWWGASYEVAPGTAEQNTLNRTSIQAALTSGADKKLFNSFFTVDGAITYHSYSTIEGVEGFFTGAPGINFVVTVSADTSLFSPVTTSQEVILKNMKFSIDSTSVFPSSGEGYEIILHNHKGGRFARVENCYFVNNKGADAGLGNYYAVGSKYYYTASPVAYIFDIWIQDNIWSGFNTDLWANGDDTVGSDLGLAVGWKIDGNFFSSTNPANNNADYANLRVNAGRQFRITNNTFNGKGISGTGLPNIALIDDTRNVEIVANYYEEGGNGKIKVVLDDEADDVLIIDSILTNQSVSDVTDTGYGNYTFLGSTMDKFGGSTWTHSNRIITNQSRVQKFSGGEYQMAIADSGSTLWSNVDGYTFRLPAANIASGGLCLRAQNYAVDGTALIRLGVASGNNITGTQITGAIHKGRVNTKATAKLGDFIEVTNDGVNTWFVTDQRGTWESE